MKKRTKDYYRHHRFRVINRKLGILKYSWNLDINDEYPHPWIVHPGKLSKAKLNCSCKMCKYEKHYDIPKAKNKRKLDSMKQEIEEYFK